MWIQPKELKTARKGKADCNVKDRDVFKQDGSVIESKLNINKYPWRILCIKWKKKQNAPPESHFELRHWAQTLHCGIHVTGVTKVCQATRQLHLEMTQKYYSKFMLFHVQPNLKSFFVHRKSIKNTTKKRNDTKNLKKDPYLGINQSYSLWFTKNQKMLNNCLLSFHPGWLVDLYLNIFQHFILKFEDIAKIASVSSSCS